MPMVPFVTETYQHRSPNVSASQTLNLYPELVGPDSKGAARVDSILVGTPGTAPSTFLEVGAAAKVLSKLGVPMNVRWSAFYDEDASLALANGLQNVFPNEIATKAIEEASIGKYSKFELFENQSLALHTVGIATGTPLINGATQDVTYAASGDAWSQTLLVDTWSNSITDIVKAGDVFTIADVFSVNRKTRQSTSSSVNWPLRIHPLSWPRE